MSTQISMKTESTIENISYSDIAVRLLDDKLLLTALELYFELLEAGKDVPKLREFFSNPGNFEQQTVSRLEQLTSIPRSSSQATLDSLDFTRYSEDGERGVDERVAVLEFELRKAKETINSLRANLTDATTDLEESSDQVLKSSNLCDPIKPHEKRCLNFLINEYLLHHNYKLTSITFADENEDQDFEDWDDVGLNMSKPAELVQLYRDGLKCAGLVATCEQCCQTDDVVAEEMTKMTALISSLEFERSQLKSQIETLHHPQPVHPGDPTCNIDEPDRVANELAHAIDNDTTTIDPLSAIDTDRNSTHFDVPCVARDNGRRESRRIDHANIDGGKVDLDRRSSQLDRDSTHFAEDLLSAHTDKFELIGDRTQTSTNGSQDRLSLEIVGDDHSSLNENDWTRVSYTPTVTSPTHEDDVINHALSQKNYPVAFQKEILSRCYINAAHAHPLCIELDALDHQLTLEDYLDLVTKTVVQQSNNDDLLPLILSSILLHTDQKQKEGLIQLLFNSKKRPNEAERKIIIAGLHSILKHSTSDLDSTESSLLNPLWEQIGSKYPERRLLAAELCAAFGPHLRPAALSMFVLPILTQLLLEDKEEGVKIATVYSLALTVTLLCDVDKYIHIEELVLVGLRDVSRDIVNVTAHLLLPVVAKWSLDIRRLQSHLLDKLMQLIASQVKKTVEQEMSSTSASTSPSHSKWELRACASLQALTSLLPYLVVFVASADFVLDRLSSDKDLAPAIPRPHFAPLCKGLFNPSVFYNEVPVPSLMRVFDHLSTNENQEWDDLSWLRTSFLPKLLDIAESVSISHHPTLVSHCISLFRSFCAGLGPHLSRKLLVPLFLTRVGTLEKSLANVGSQWPTSLVLLPLYVLGVLVELADAQEEIQSLLKDFLVSLALAGAPLESLSYTIRELSRFGQCQDTVVAALWEGVVHARPAVRVVTAQLTLGTIAHISDALLTTKIVPALVTLSSDPDVTVKTATIPVFGSLLLNQTKKEIQDKTYFQFQTFLGDETLRDNHPAQICLISTLGKVSPCSPAWFREETIAPQLCSWATTLCLLQSATRKHDILLSLLDAFSNVLYTSLSSQTIQTYMLPGLRHLEIPCTELVPGQLETLRGMIKEAESRAGHRPPPATPAQSRTSSSVQKINKILSPLQTSNLFSRKKN